MSQLIGLFESEFVRCSYNTFYQSSSISAANSASSSAVSTGSAGAEDAAASPRIANSKKQAQTNGWKPLGILRIAPTMRTFERPEADGRVQRRGDDRGAVGDQRRDVVKVAVKLFHDRFGLRSRMPAPLSTNDLLRIRVKWMIDRRAAYVCVPDADVEVIAASGEVARRQHRHGLDPVRVVQRGRNGARLQVDGPPFPRARAM